MSAPDAAVLEALLAPGADPAGEELKACCAAAYAHPAIRWLTGGELHPGGEATTRRTLELAGLGAGARLLDVASGSGASALLAARELSAEVVGVEYGQAAVREACEAARAAGLAGQAGFAFGDAEALPVADGAFEVVLCECSLCTFPDKERAVAEMTRVLKPGGRLGLSDVVVEEGQLPDALRGALATVACVGSALSQTGYEELLARAGLRVERTESVDEEADRFAARIEERLRGARLVGFDALAGAPLRIEEAIESVRAARDAIAAGALGYSIFIAAAP